MYIGFLFFFALYSFLLNGLVESICTVIDRAKENKVVVDIKSGDPSSNPFRAAVSDLVAFHPSKANPFRNVHTCTGTCMSCPDS